MQPMTFQDYRRAFLEEPLTDQMIKSQLKPQLSMTLKKNSESTGSVSVVFVPTFQGTLLYDCSNHSRCTPLFLSPMSPWSYQHIYERLQMTTTRIIPHAKNSVDYPAFTCAPSPLSHIGHCNVVPTLGAVHELSQKLSQNDPPITMLTLAYDWRQSLPTLLSPTSEASLYWTMLALVEKYDKIIIVSHGTACRLTATLINSLKDNVESKISALICAAPAKSTEAKMALENGTGLLTAGGRAHVHGDACSNVRGEGRVDFTSVNSEMGLSKRRLRTLGHVAGPWDVVDARLASTQADRIALAKRFPSIIDIAATSDLVPAIPSVHRAICVDAQSAVDRRDACQTLFKSAEVVKSNADAFNLSEILGNVIKEVVNSVHGEKNGQ